MIFCSSVLIILWSSPLQLFCSSILLWFLWSSDLLFFRSSVLLLFCCSSALLFFYSSVILLFWFSPLLLFCSSVFILIFWFSDLLFLCGSYDLLFFCSCVDLCPFIPLRFCQSGCSAVMVKRSTRSSLYNLEPRYHEIAKLTFCGFPYYILLL